MARIVDLDVSIVLVSLCHKRAIPACILLFVVCCIRADVGRGTRRSSTSIQESVDSPPLLARSLLSHLRSLQLRYSTASLFLKPTLQGFGTRRSTRAEFGEEKKMPNKNPGNWSSKSTVMVRSLYECNHVSSRQGQADGSVVPIDQADGHTRQLIV